MLAQCPQAVDQSILTVFDTPLPLLIYNHLPAQHLQGTRFWFTIIHYDMITILLFDPSELICHGSKLFRSGLGLFSAARIFHIFINQHITFLSFKHLLYSSPQGNSRRPTIPSSILPSSHTLPLTRRQQTRSCFFISSISITAALSLDPTISKNIVTCKVNFYSLFCDQNIRQTDVAVERMGLFAHCTKGVNLML